jgi:Translation initiation factor eIF3 subunit
MSDSGDDWEAQAENEEILDKAISAKDEEKKKAAAFKDEDAYNSDEERKKKEAEKKAAAAQAAAASSQGDKKKSKPGTKDYDAMFEQRIKANKTASSAMQARIEEIKKSGLSQEAQAHQLAMAAEMDITESLFADLDVNAKSLNLEKDYVNFGKKVSTTLYEGQAPYRIPVFFKELVRDLSKHIDSKNIKVILDSVTALYNEKVKEEKEKEKKGGSKPAKAQLKSGKQDLNKQLVGNLMGDDDDEYGDEYAGGGRAQEEEYDFM